MKGARCRYNELHNSDYRGPERCKKREGTIIGKSKTYNCWRILWDGLIQPKYAHVDNIEILPKNIKLEQIAIQLTEINNHYMTHIQKPFTMGKHPKLLEDINETIIGIKLHWVLREDDAKVDAAKANHHCPTFPEVIELLQRAYQAINEQREDPRKY